MDSDNSVIYAVHELIKNGDLSGAQSLLNKNFDESDATASSLRGYLLINSNADVSTHIQASKLFRIGAEIGRSYDQRELGIILVKLGETSAALEWFKKASMQGDSEASLEIYWILNAQKKIEALDYLNSAHFQGNARATQIMAIEKIKGRYGVKSVLSGVKTYFINIPNLVRYVKNRSRIT